MDTGLAGAIGSYSADHGFRTFYDGTLQKGDAQALLIPCNAKKIPIEYSRIVAFINSAQEGVDVLISCYKGAVFIDTAILEAGETEVYFDVTPGTVDADDKVTFVLDWVGVPTTLGITLTMGLE